MKTNSILACSILAVACGGNVPLIASDGEQIQNLFSQPPDDAKIMVRWWWFGPSVTEPEIDREMRVMKAGGIGGFEVEPTYPMQVDGELPGVRNLKFLSPEYLNSIAFTAARAKDLGLRMSLTLGSGWPYGGPQFSAAESASAVISQDILVPRGEVSLALPPLSAGQELVAAFAKLGDSYREVPVIDHRVTLPEARVNDTAVELVISRGGIMAVKRPALGGEGNVIDNYSPTAVEKFIKEVAEPVIQACGPNPIYSLFCDSLEVSGENWTPNLLAEFQQRRGYDLRPLLPALFHDIGPKTLDIRHDWGRTVTELFNDYFNRRFTRLAHDYRTRFRIQGYGTPPAALYSYAYCDLPEGEQSDWKRFTNARWASSASHLLGRTVTSSETFTYLHSPVFRATPLDMKAEADLHFLSGINQLICHGWPYTAPGAIDPGWSFYAAGVLNEKNPWWIVMPDVAKYLQRVSYLLREGSPCNDVAVFLSNSDAWAHLDRGFGMNSFFAPKVGNLVRAITDAGYNLDFFDDQLLDLRGAVNGSTLDFGEVHYRVVVLPGVERILPATMLKLEEFARHGGTVIATRRLPDLAPGYLEIDADTIAIRDSVRRLFRDQNAPGIFIEDESRLAAEIEKRLAPDVKFSVAAEEIGVVHRRTDAGEVFFVANTSNRVANARAEFRVAGMKPELWDPMNGRIGTVAIAATSTATTSIDLSLEPYSSTFVVFTKSPLSEPIVASRLPVAVPPSPLDLSTNWKVRFGRQSPQVSMPTLVSWTEDPAQINFSGVATYEKTISINPELLQPGLSLALDFGPSSFPNNPAKAQGYRVALEPPVRDAAIIYINDQRVSSLWCPPYTVDVTGMLRAGENHLRIEVANLAVNHMADIKLPNFNYDGVTEKFGNRFKPQDMALIKPVAAGLLGPIRLVATPVAK